MNDLPQDLSSPKVTRSLLRCQATMYTRNAKRVDRHWRDEARKAGWGDKHLSMQGEKLGPTSRHQAAAVGSTIYIHNHRTTSSILALDTQASPPKLISIPVSTTDGYPASRSIPNSCQRIILSPHPFLSLFLLHPVISLPRR